MLCREMPIPAYQIPKKIPQRFNRAGAKPGIAPGEGKWLRIGLYAVCGKDDQAADDQASDQEYGHEFG